MTCIDLPTASGLCTEVPFEKCPDLTWRVSFANFKCGSEGQAPATILSGNQAGKHHLSCGAKIGRHHPFFFFFFLLSFFFFTQRVPRHAILSHAQSLTAASPYVWCPEFYDHWTRFSGCRCDAPWTPGSREGGGGRVTFLTSSAYNR